MRATYFVIAVLLGIDTVFIRFRVAGLSYDRLLEFIFFFIFYRSFLMEIKTNSFFRKWSAFLSLFAVLQLLINLKLAIGGSIEFAEVYTDFVKCISFLVFSFLFLLIAKKDIKYINVLIFCHFLIVVFAFLQHPLSPIASQMMDVKRMLYSSVQATGLGLGREETYISGGFAERFRLSGPFLDSIRFSYFAFSSLAINAYMYLRYRKKWYLAMICFLLMASMLTQTRSLLLAEICLILGYLFFVPGPKMPVYRIQLITTAVIATSFVIVSQDLIQQGNTRLTRITSQGKGDSRPLLWLTGIYTVMNHPLGVSEKEYTAIKEEMHIRYGRSAVLFLSAHNGLINIGFHYSLLGYVLFFFFVLFLLRAINLLEPKYVVFFRLVLLGYLIHTSFHNNFVLNSDYLFLMVLVLIYIDQYYHPKNKIETGNV